MENDKLTEILIQIALLNEKIDTILLNNNKLSRRVDGLEDKYNKINEELIEYKMIKKYSKYIPILFVISVIMSLLIVAKFFGIM